MRFFKFLEMNIRYITLIFVLIQFFFLAEANDVLGCGGFIKSHVPIDFSKIEVKLVTKQGIVKDKTNCAPNNGYYFVPLYDKGELKLELSPPPGWSFTPKEVNLNIDGTDLCSQGKDINFIFEGFGIAGKVESLGSPTAGPQGVLVKLLSNEGARTTLTLEDGTFSFSPVYPGTYTVSISHPRWKIYKESLKVDVTEGNTVLPVNSLVIQGYGVSGKMLTADGSPVQNTIIALFAQLKNQDNVLVAGCEKSEIPAIHLKDHFLCHVRTDSSGEFIFPVVPSGQYFVTPYYKEENIYYLPEKIEFSVQHTGVQLTENFQVIGFTVPGRVTNGNDGIANAKIFLNGNQVATSDKLGRYKLEKLKVGTYRLKAEADNLVFEELTVNIDTNLANLPDLAPSAFKVCGKVVSDKPQSISITQIGSSNLIQTQTDKNQEFCQYLPPGKYEVHVTVNEEDRQNGLQFFPLTQKFEVISENIMNLVFSQLKSSISGRINCIQNKDCEGLSITLKSGSEELALPVRNSIYSGSDIHPGVYEVILSKNELCWKSLKQTVNINSQKVEIPPFVQTGYQLQFISSHEAKITYKTLNQGKLVEIPIGRGVTSTCVDAPGHYSFSVNSCHEFDSHSFTYNTASEKNQITLNAQRHAVELSIQSEKDHGPIEVSVQTGDEEFKQIVKFVKNAYEIKLMLKPFEVATLTPKSDKLFFSPRAVKVEGTSDCTRLGNKFTAILGKVFQGHISPPLPGVIITVEDLSNNEIYTVQTDAKGVYKFAPLDGKFDFKINAQKDSYIFTGPDSSGTFTAQKLAEISVEVLDEDDKSPLMGVLLSLSGGQSFRKNLQTDANGRITYHSLSASDYFLRPMMKEYRFEPISKLITVQEGEAIKVVLTGKRVAFSAFGKLTTVNEDPVENVNIIASGVDNCTGLSEEATTDITGGFRIRGLQPFCTFKVYVQIGSDHLSMVERTSPESIEIKNINQDAKGLHITVFRPVLITDVLLKIYAEKVEHYRFLKVTIYRETTNPSVVYSTSVDSLTLKVDKNRNHGILIHLPTLQLDNNDYSIHLEPAHSIKGTPQVEYFNANTSFKYIEMHFNPKTNTKEQPIKQSSIWAMIFILVVLLFAYNIQIVSDLLKEHLNFNIESLSSYIPIISSSNKSVNDYDDIDQIVQDINNVRKHRPKKTN